MHAYCNLPRRRIGPACLLAAWLCGCATAPPGPAGATIWEKAGRAVVSVSKDPYTLAPALGAAVFQIGKLDEEVSAWAASHTPVFGSRGNAAEASDWLRRAGLAAWLSTGIASPVAAGGNAAGTRLLRLAAGAAAIAGAGGATRLLKTRVGRGRPFGQDEESFPSGHATGAAVGARLTAEHLRLYGLTPASQRIADAGLLGVAVLTGWARVEAGMHYPADVLAGAAIGNFFAALAGEALLRPGGPLALRFYRAPLGGWVAQLTLSF